MQQQKTCREAEQERQWKQLQALRQQQAQQQQQTIHDQRTQVKSLKREAYVDFGLYCVGHTAFLLQKDRLLNAV
jgi:hypothetical protein